MRRVPESKSIPKAIGVKAVPIEGHLPAEVEETTPPDLGIPPAGAQSGAGVFLFAAFGGVARFAETRMVVECADQSRTGCFLEGKMDASVNSLNCKAKGVDERLRGIAACPHEGTLSSSFLLVPLCALAICWGLFLAQVANGGSLRGAASRIVVMISKVKRGRD